MFLLYLVAITGFGSALHCDNPCALDSSTLHPVVLGIAPLLYRYLRTFYALVMAVSSAIESHSQDINAFLHGQ